MTPIKLGNTAFRGEIDPLSRSPEFEAALAQVPDILRDPRWERAREVLQTGRNTVVALTLPLGQSRSVACVVKIFGAAGFKRLKTLVRPSKAAKAWRGARALEAAWIETPHPLAYLERRARGVVAESYFVAARIPSLPEIRSLFREPGPEGPRPMLAALAGSVAALHSAGLLHRDLSDGNVLVRRDDAVGYGFVYLDTNRVRLRRRLGAAARARNLVRLGVPPADRMYFLERYAAARGETLGPIFVHAYKVSKRAFSTWLRVKKALRLKKAARALRIQ